MNTIQITVNNSLKSKNSPREDRRPTIFKRILRHLIEKSNHPGKIFPIYVEIDGDYKIFGAFTFNSGGSISFFPDLYTFEPFDHITINKDFINKGGHLTSVDRSNKHKKVLAFDAEKLENGDYHLITFIMKDGELLMDLFPTIELPQINVEDHNEKRYLTVLQEALQNTTGIIQFPEDTEGVYCIQVTLSLKKRADDEIKIYTKPISDFLTEIQDLNKPIFAKKFHLSDKKKSGFFLSITSFRVKGTPKDKMYIAVNNGRVISEELRSKIRTKL